MNECHCVDCNKVMNVRKSIFDLHSQRCVDCFDKLRAITPVIEMNEGSTCVMYKDEFERLKEGRDAKVFINGMYFYIEVEE